MFAQVSVSGKVVDAGGIEMPGVNIAIKGTMVGTMTGADGTFTLSSIPGGKDAVLVFSFIGFRSQEVKVGNQTFINVKLEEDTEQLEEVVVIGYGSAKAKDLTAPIDLTVKEVHGQYSIKNLQGRSVRLDILAVDRENRAYNIEVQRSDRGASEKRARYNSSLLDANLTDAGDDYDALNETYIIFITENDVLKAGLPIYHVDRIIQETGEPFGDEAHIIYINSQIKDETELGKLMHDFTCTNPDDMNYPVLAQRVRYFKEDTKGVATMCRAFEEVREEGKREQAVESTRSMLADGMPYEIVAKYTKLSVEEVKAFDTKRSA